MAESFSDIFGMPKNDPLILLNALTTDVAVLKQADDSIGRRIALMEAAIMKNDELIRLVVELQTDMKNLIADVTETKTRVETVKQNVDKIAVLETQVRQNRESIIPGGIQKIEAIVDDIDDLRDDFEAFKAERWGLIGSTAAAILGLIAFVSKDYILPWLVPLIHK
jgi:hypothetical protein